MGSQDGPHRENLPREWAVGRVLRESVSGEMAETRASQEGGGGCPGCQPSWPAAENLTEGRGPVRPPWAAMRLWHGPERWFCRCPDTLCSAPPLLVHLVLWVPTAQVSPLDGGWAEGARVGARQSVGSHWAQ